MNVVHGMAGGVGKEGRKEGKEGKAFDRHDRGGKLVRRRQSLLATQSSTQKIRLREFAHVRTYL